MSTSTVNKTISFCSLDGHPLTGTFFEPSTEPHTILLVNSGTGIPRQFYSRFARHASARGFAVLTYDYRGIGGSAPDSLRGYEARYRDWGQRDVPGAISWLCEKYPTIPLAVVGHSTGGQQLGLAKNVGRVRAAVFVTVSTGYWRGMPTYYKWLTFVLWKTYIPLTSKLYGYAPSSKIRWGENLPRGVAREWGSWCLEPDYMAAFFDEGGHREPLDGSPFGPLHFEDAVFPIRAYCFTDDPIATRLNVPPMLTLYERADVETEWIDPSDLGLEKIGHLGFFRSSIGTHLWDKTLDWLRATAHRAV
jgi:predicted alpha/beta hydrolase